MPETESAGAQEKLFYTAEDLRYCTSNINHCRMRIYERRDNSGHNSTAGADTDIKQENVACKRVLLEYERKENLKKMIQILELFGGIGSPRCALRNIGIPVKAIDYVEIDEKAVRSYNAMFADDLPYKTQSVVGWNLKPDILIHGSPCQDFSIAGHQKGADEGSETRSSLMWETIHIIEQMGAWKPRYVIWENVKNVTSRL